MGWILVPGLCIFWWLRPPGSPGAGPSSQGGSFGTYHGMPKAAAWEADAKHRWCVIGTDIPEKLTASGKLDDLMSKLRPFAKNGRIVTVSLKDGTISSEEEWKLESTDAGGDVRTRLDRP